MYKLIIVDDEKSIRNGMLKLPWEEWGFQVTGTAGDGLEALELIAEEKPDVVLSDIRMPNMDGIELMQYLNQNYPEIRIIILSGYSDFEYLNFSIKNKVIEYLLKPTDIDEFEILFKNLKENLDSERQKSSKYENSKWYYLDSLLLNLLLEYSPDDDSNTEDIIKSELNIDVNNCYAALLYMEWQPQFRDVSYLTKTKKQLIDTINKIPCDFGMRFFLGYQEKMTGLIGCDKIENIRNFLNFALDELYNQTGIEVFACISSPCTDKRMLIQCVQQTIVTAHHKAFSPDDKIGFYVPIKTANTAFRDISFNYDLLLNSILTLKSEQGIAEVERVFKEFEAVNEASYSHIENMCLELLFFLSRKSMEYNISFEEIMEDLGFGYDDLRKMVGLKTLKKMISDSVLALIDCFSLTLQAEDKNSSLAKKIKKIVDEEYMQNYISLEYISGRVEKSSAYVSRLFKDEFGSNFSEYITGKRLEKSKELLKDHSVKIYEIAKLMGYADVSNFIKVFKKKYGISPGDYRNYVK